MTNKAIAAILEYLCMEARNSAQAAFGVMDLLREVAPEFTRGASLATGSASAAQLLRSVDDLRELLDSTPAAPAALEEFDMASGAHTIIEGLNLASGRGDKPMILEAPLGPLLVIQDRKAAEQVLTRVLDTALKLTEAGEVHVKLCPGRGESGIRMAILGSQAGLAVRLTEWLTANPYEMVLGKPAEVPYGLSVMVAGKLLRAMGGSAERTREFDGLALDLPSHVRSAGDPAAPGHETPPDALSILVAEDSDESFALSEVVLAEENVWRAHDGPEALRMIQQQRFDIVFMDVHMPGMDGYNVIRSMREWETQTGQARTPMVVLSADDVETQRQSAAQCGCSGFLRKPLRRTDVTHLLDRLKQDRVLVS